MTTRRTRNDVALESPEIIAYVENKMAEEYMNLRKQYYTNAGDPPEAAEARALMDRRRWEGKEPHVRDAEFRNAQSEADPSKYARTDWKGEKYELTYDADAWKDIEAMKRRWANEALVQSVKKEREPSPGDNLPVQDAPSTAPASATIPNTAGPVRVEPPKDEPKNKDEIHPVDAQINGMTGNSLSRFNDMANPTPELEAQIKADANAISTSMGLPKPFGNGGAGIVVTGRESDDGYVISTDSGDGKHNLVGTVSLEALLRDDLGDNIHVPARFEPKPGYTNEFPTARPMMRINREDALTVIRRFEEQLREAGPDRPADGRGSGTVDGAPTRSAAEPVGEQVAGSSMPVGETNRSPAGVDTLAYVIANALQYALQMPKASDDPNRPSGIPEQGFVPSSAGTDPAKGTTVSR
jgi:hypothetical protein